MSASAEVQLGPAARSQRRLAISRSATETGLDFVRVREDGDGAWSLVLHFVPADGGSAGKSAVPQGITPAHVRLAADGDGYVGLRVDSVRPGPVGDTLQVRVHAELDGGADPTGARAPTYRLQLVEVPQLDWLFSGAEFTLAPDGDGAAAPASGGKVQPGAGVHIDYLAKDYASFRKLMLDSIALQEPLWTERSAADVGIALVEVLAYAADYLSYHQDAVATEAYLGTARRRVSLRRHARLLDYSVNEGCNATVMAQVRVRAGVSDVVLPRGVQVVTAGGGAGACVETGSQAYEELMRRDPQVFETLHTIRLYAAHNEIALYNWGAADYTLPAGATRATLRDPRADGAEQGLALRPGDVLIFESAPEWPGRNGGAPRIHRHGVRLMAVKPREDRLGGDLHGGAPRSIPLLEVEWSNEDALPFAVRVPGGEGAQGRPGGRVLGNVVVADHGRTLREELPPVPPAGPYRPKLTWGPLTRSVTPGRIAPSRTLASLLARRPSAVVPAVRLSGPDGEWTVRPDLLGSDRFAREFVVEAEDDGARLRFGDGVLGKRPPVGARMTATYRVGNGTRGNIGREVIRHLVLDPEALTLDEFEALLAAVEGVWNPSSASGGIRPESDESIRLNAPLAFHRQERCITEADYAEAARAVEGVARATAVVRWTGSWDTALVYVQREGGHPADGEFRDRVREELEALRPVGHALEVLGPQWASLDIVLSVRVLPGRVRTTVERALLTALGSGTLADGTPAFFHPDRFTFGQPAYLSQVVAEAMRVPGVDRVEALRFTRWRGQGRDEVHEEIRVAPTEIVRVRNDPRTPHRGRITFRMEGGE